MDNRLRNRARERGSSPQPLPSLNPPSRLPFTQSASPQSEEPMQLGRACLSAEERQRWISTSRHVIASWPPVLSFQKTEVISSGGSIDGHNTHC